QRQIAHPRHAHELRHPVYLRRTRAAFARLAVPATGKIISLGALDVMHAIEHNHALGYFGSVFAKFAAVRIAAPDFESCLWHFEFLISISFLATVLSLSTHRLCRQNNCCSNMPFWQFPRPLYARLSDR